jgi:hypothetical protein
MLSQIEQVFEPDSGAGSCPPEASSCRHPTTPWTTPQRQPDDTRPSLSLVSLGLSRDRTRRRGSTHGHEKSQPWTTLDDPKAP